MQFTLPTFILILAPHPLDHPQRPWVDQPAQFDKPGAARPANPWDTLYAVPAPIPSTFFVEEATDFSLYYLDAAGVMGYQYIPRGTPVVHEADDGRAGDASHAGDNRAADSPPANARAADGLHRPSWLTLADTVGYRVRMVRSSHATASPSTYGDDIERVVLLGGTNPRDFDLAVATEEFIRDAELAAPPASAKPKGYRRWDAPPERLPQSDYATVLVERGFAAGGLATREAAQGIVERMGMRSLGEVLPALVRGLRSEDAEVVGRCEDALRVVKYGR